ncbi:conserved membrane hypothetical protein [Candidatus Terasakiella magnetica]|uniref:DUF4405 domain-containing protein n=1 Tax=Candidatus Terasakiella magnetica TaxID=1867952 RepID=A0A1C3RGK8_9PROT|nr:hypothetical protein [Candidatus Terasakiella magnetica]SCA56322.1 conserved membrane hypothetical protein [Candidatus Terasakiella magnetica]
MTSTTVDQTALGPRAQNITKAQSFLQRYATVATIATSLVVGTSGVMLFFHLGESAVKGLHEWVGMGFVLAALLHGVRHLKAMGKLLTKTRTKLALGLMMLVSLGFIMGAVFNPNGGNPFKQYVKISQSAPISALAPVVGMSSETLMAKFKAAGVENIQLKQSLRDVAQSSGVELHELFGLLVKK